MQIDPRGQQFAAALTVAVLAGVLLTAPGPVGLGLLLWQSAVFALGAVRGPQHTPYAWLFRTLLRHPARPVLGPPAELEDAAAPRFAQTVGLVFAVLGLLGLATGATVLGLVAIGAALAAALLNAAFGLCLGCEAYVLLARTGVLRNSTT